MKLLFFGTPGLAVPFLEACAGSNEVAAVVTRPDQPSGRGLALQPSAVKAAAGRRGLKVLEPETPTPLAAELAAFKADMAVVVAYGKILKPPVLAATRLGFMNVHFSLLPKYRGAAPMAWTLINGETKSGVTLFWLDEGMDTGPVQLRHETEVSPEDDAGTLGAKLIALGVPALEAALKDVAAGRVRREPQVGEASLAPKLTRVDARIDFNRPAAAVHDRIRGLSGGPRAFLQLKEAVLILKTEVDRDSPEPSAAPGSIVRVARDRGVLVQCRAGRLWLVEVQPEGKKQLPAADFLNGLRLKPGDLLVSS